MKFIRDLSIGKKIGGIVIILISLLIISSVYGFIKVSGIGSEMKTVQSEDMPLIQLVSDITVKQLEKAILIEKAMRIAGVSDASESISELHQQVIHLADEIDREIKEGEAILLIAKTHPLSDQQLTELLNLEKYLISIEKEHMQYESKVEHLMDLLESGEKVTAAEVHDVEVAQTKINHHLEEVLVNVETMTGHALETVLHDEESALQGMILISLLSSITGIILGILITRAITKPLAHAVATANRLAEGDLTVEVNVRSNDETGQLLLAMRKLTQNLRDIITQVATSTEQLTGATVEMTAVTKQTADNLQAQELELSQTSAAMEQMSATVQEVAQSAALAAESASKADTAASRGRSIVDQVSGSIHTLAAEIEDTQAVITRLDHETENVDSILEVITSIAEQTNLLALNAAIEAARAGEQGRGFAVVADEVRTLASRTQMSIAEIQQMTGRLKSEAKNSVQAMQNGHATTVVTVDLSTQAEQSLSQISEAVTTINEMNVQIASAAEQQSAVAEQTSSSINKINQAAIENSAGAQQLATATEEIAQLSESLKQLVGHFKVA
ncbi:MAG: methyl-accepting chemotaxis protein [Pseudomonadales bacterium]|nr:methyl-accepting chemotaxis protein [Pseudomonadales bacterium]NRA16964.1 methyl-accepting chemotaxis protein [Oceanospirillaceae bacterium]